MATVRKAWTYHLLGQSACPDGHAAALLDVCRCTLWLSAHHERGIRSEIYNIVNDQRDDERFHCKHSSHTDLQEKTELVSLTFSRDGSHGCSQDPPASATASQYPIRIAYGWDACNKSYLNNCRSWCQHGQRPGTLLLQTVQVIRNARHRTISIGAVRLRP